MKIGVVGVVPSLINVEEKIYNVFPDSLFKEIMNKVKQILTHENFIEHV